MIVGTDGQAINGAEALVDGNGNPIANAPQRGVLVIDGFSPYASAARQSALDSGFGTWKPNTGEVGSSKYDGMNFWGDHAMLLMPLMWHMGAAVVANAMFFRVCNAETEGAYVHSDREHGAYTAVVYLSEHDEEDFGTGFYRNRRTGEQEMRSFADLREDPDEFARLKTEMVDGGEQFWEQTSFVRGKFNRAVVFEAPLYHARRPRHGFGNDPETGRMVWVCHFTFLRGPQ